MAETSGASMKNTETRKQDHRNPSHVEQIKKCYQDVVTMKKRESRHLSGLAFKLYGKILSQGWKQDSPSTETQMIFHRSNNLN